MDSQSSEGSDTDICIPVLHATNLEALALAARDARSNRSNSQKTLVLEENL